MFTMSRRLYKLGLVCLFGLSSCGGSGGGAPPNPIGFVPEPPAATLSTNMAGVWTCVDSVIIQSNTAFTEEYDPGDQLILEWNRVLAENTLNTGFFSFLQADLESSYGVALDWYINQIDGSNVAAGFGITGPGGNIQLGIRLVLVNHPGNLFGYTAVIQRLSGQPEKKWVSEVSFLRNAIGEATTLPRDTETESEGASIRSMLERVMRTKPAAAGGPLALPHLDSGRRGG